MKHLDGSLAWKSVAIAIFLSTLCCYLRWGGGNSGFVGEMEWQIIFGKATSSTFIHPFVLLPLLGQLLLLAGLVLSRVRRLMILAGVAFCSPLVLFILLAGVLSRSAPIMLSTLPFLLSAICAMRMRKRHVQANNSGHAPENFYQEQTRNL